MRRILAQCDLEKPYFFSQGNTLSNWARAQLALTQFRLFLQTELLPHEVSNLWFLAYFCCCHTFPLKCLLLHPNPFDETRRHRLITSPLLKVFWRKEMLKIPYRVVEKNAWNWDMLIMLGIFQKLAKTRDTLIMLIIFVSLGTYSPPSRPLQYKKPTPD